MQRVLCEREFEPVTIVFDTEEEVTMMRLIAQNVQPPELAGWSEKVSQAQASTFLTSLYRELQK